MKRAVTLVAAVLLPSAAGACDPPRSERWEAAIEAWPQDVPMGGTATDRRVYVEGEEAFEAMMQAEHEAAGH